jgi:Uma2 family endonuclease
MGEAALKRVTVDEFLAWHGEDEQRFELIGGEIVAMSPSMPYHGAIAGKVAELVGQRLKPPCRVITEAGIRLSWRSDTYYLADVAITCTPLGRSDWSVPNPVIIIEVLSPSTEAKDRGIKLLDYRHLPSVQSIVLIASEEQRVELWRRGEGAWTVTELEAADRLELVTFGFDIPVEALYDGLDFSQGATAQS